MKLIFCPACQDVVRLFSRGRFCFCEKSWGQYKKDGKNAIVGGEAVPLGFGNGTFLEALSKRPQDGLGYRFTAFVIPHSCPTIEVENEEKNTCR